MEYLIRRDYRLFFFALTASLVFHALVLCIQLKNSDSAVRHDSNGRDSRLAVTLKPQTPAVPPPQSLPEHTPKTTLDHRPKILMARPDTVTPPLETQRNWTMAERADMDQFLNELTVEAKPRTGRELAQKALTMARTLSVPEQPDNELIEMRQKLTAAKVDPFSVEMYFDALFRKMNRSAAMISQERRTKGSHVAAVRVVVNHDGVVKSFRVLWAADQQAEIAYIKAVVDQAAPFPVFPEDIRNATDSIVLQICILPDRFGGGSGATFSRMSPGQSCGAG